MKKAPSVKQALEDTNSKLYNKPNYQVWYHRVAAWFTSFLVEFDKYATTMPFFFTAGYAIYLMSYAKGQLGELVTDRYFPLISHEIAHSYIFERDGKFWGGLKYIFSKDYRKANEMQARAVEIWNFVQDEDPTFEEVKERIKWSVDSLENYRLSVDKKDYSALETVALKSKKYDFFIFDPDAIKDLLYQVPSPIQVN